MASYPPTRELATFKKPSFSGERCEPNLPVYPQRQNYTCRYIFGCPLALHPNGLRSCGAIRVQLNRLLFRQHFSSLNFNYSLSNIEKLSTGSQEMCRLTVARGGQGTPKEAGKEVQEVTPLQVLVKQLPTRAGEEPDTPKGSPGQLLGGGDDKMAGSSESIQTPTQQVRPVRAFQETTTSKDGSSDYEFPVSDSQPELECEESEDEYGYETDTDEEEEGEEEEDEDDFVQFSDESLPTHPHLTSQEDPPSLSTLTPNDMSYLSLNSEESGYCDNGSSDSHENWSDDEESDTDEIPPDDRSCEELWKSFEAKALSCSPQLTQKTTDRKDSGKNIEVTPKPVARAEERSRCVSLPLPTCPVPPPQGKMCKQVSFKPEPELAVVHHMFAWSYAYRSCRKGPWEQYARDRVHFRRRIETLSCILTPCLERKLKCCSGVS